MHVRYTKACCAGKRADSGISPPTGAAKHRSLSALCALLFLSLLGTVGTVQSQPMDAAGMYGAILLHEGVGGYVLEAVISFTAAVVLTVLYIKFRKRKQIP